MYSLNTGSAIQTDNTGGIYGIKGRISDLDLHYPRSKSYVCFTQDLRVISLVSSKPLNIASTLSQELNFMERNFDLGNQSKCVDKKSPLHTVDQRSLDFPKIKSP